MRVALLYTPVPDDARPDERDSRTQRTWVAGVLRALGIDVAEVVFDLDLDRVAGDLNRRGSACVFNLVEAVAGADRLIHLAPSLLEHLGMPYTGSPLDALLLTTNKIAAKRIMRSAGLPTPDWWAGGESYDAAVGTRVITKSAWDHASVDITDRSVWLPDSAAALERALVTRGQFVETYIEGREFNLSMLATARGPRVLSAAEMTFRDYPPGKPRIVGYEAKWAEGSFEQRNTVRSFSFPPEDGALIERIRELALRCWRLFGLRGYARVDFRVDAAGEPWVLEVNANPCLAPDAGFMAAAARTGLSAGDVIRALLEDAVRAPSHGSPCELAGPPTSSGS